MQENKLELDEIKAMLEKLREEIRNSAALSELLIEVEAAKLLRVKPQTLAVWRCQGSGPAYRKHGSRVVYRRSDLEKFSDRKAVGTSK